MDRSRFRRLGILLAVTWAASLLSPHDLRAKAPDAREQQFEEALNQASTADFLQTPLDDVMAYFSDLHGVRIHVDRPALDEVGLDEREPITVSADGIRLKSMLGLILEPHGLTWTVRHDSLVITTYDAARKAVSTRIYHLDGLTERPEAVRGRSRGGYGSYGGGYEEGYGSMMGDAPLNPVELLEVVTTTIEPHSWAEDGPGRASPLSIGGRTIFVIRQDYRTHRMIDQFLDGLRQIVEEDPKADEKPKTPSKVYSRRPAPPAAQAKPPQARPAADPFGTPAPAKAKSSVSRPADDPFGAPAPVKTKPMKDDPFGAPAPVKTKPSKHDPFAVPPAARDPFGGHTPAPADDPFGPPASAKPSKDDPFAASPTARDPFGGGAAPVNDPFGTPTTPGDPFGVPTAEDPFD